MKREWIDCPQAGAAENETSKERGCSFRVMQWNTLADGMIIFRAVATTAIHIYFPFFCSPHPVHPGFQLLPLLSGGPEVVQ